ncbi:hypothetical protein CR513_56046, partial [Mucuna pruriens]
MWAAEQTEDELHQQVAMMKATAEKQGGATKEAASGQPFSEEIDGTSIPPNFREVIVEPFDETQDPHARLQAFQTQMHINGGNDALNCKL